MQKKPKNMFHSMKCFDFFSFFFWRNCISLSNTKFSVFLSTHENIKPRISCPSFDNCQCGKAFQATVRHLPPSPPALRTFSFPLTLHAVITNTHKHISYCKICIFLGQACSGQEHESFQGPKPDP